MTDGKPPVDETNRITADVDAVNAGRRGMDLYKEIKERLQERDVSPQEMSTRLGYGPRFIDNLLTDLYRGVASAADDRVRKLYTDMGLGANLCQESRRTTSVESAGTSEVRKVPREVKSLCRRIDQALTAKDMTRRDLCRSLGLYPNALSRVMSELRAGHASLENPTLIKVCQNMGIRIPTAARPSNRGWREVRVDASAETFKVTASVDATVKSSDSHAPAPAAANPHGTPDRKAFVQALLAASAKGLISREQLEQEFVLAIADDPSAGA